MSQFVSTPCACGVDIVAVSPDHDDIVVAIEAHNDTPWHRRYASAIAFGRAEDELNPHRGPCICKGGEAAPRKYRKSVA